MSAATKPNCPVCHSFINVEEGVKVCAQCQTAHHIYCWDNNGGCAVQGCDCRHIEPGASKIVERIKECHYCGKQVSEKAVRCKHCHADLQLPIITSKVEESVTEETLDSLDDKFIVEEKIKIAQIFNLSILKDMFRLTLSNFLVLVIVQVVILLAIILGNTIASTLAYDFPPVAFFLKMATYVFALLMVVGYSRVALDLVRGKRISFETLFAESERLLAHFAVSILIVLLIYLGFNLFIVPGIILTFLFMFVPFVMVDEELSLMGTIKRSFGLVLRNLGLVLTWLLLMMVLNLVGMLALGLGVFISSTLTLLLLAHFYEEIN